MHIELLLILLCIIALLLLAMSFRKSWIVFYEDDYPIEKVFVFIAMIYKLCIVYLVIILLIKLSIKMYI